MPILKLETLPLEAEYALESNELWVEGSRAAVQARSVKEMVDVLSDRLFASKARLDDSLYYMFRGPHRKQDSELFQKHRIRFDVTSMPARALGSEFVKTYGHYHPIAPNSLNAFPELYQVISGTAWYLIQKRKKDSMEVEDAWLVEAKAGEKVLMPPNYGHLTINPTYGETLVMANLVEASFKSDYAPYKERRGGAFYALAESGGIASANIVPNRAYGELPELKKTTAKEFWGNKAVNGIAGNIYAEFVANPEQFSFLKKPDELL